MKRSTKILTISVCLLPIAAVLLTVGAHASDSELEPMFSTSSQCLVCHNGLATSDGTDFSIGTSWGATMMGNAARDPYWQASVKRETMDHADAAAAIEAECSRCHMPMSHHLELHGNMSPRVSAHLPLNGADSTLGALAADGVSCTVCHQIEDRNLGSDKSFSGHFVVAPAGSPDRKTYGPYEPDAGLSRIMESATGNRQTQSLHIQRSELCGSCHTLLTHPVGYPGEDHPALAEQVPYLEWKHSDFVDSMSCQDCHMPKVEEKVPLSSVMGREQSDVSMHAFRGGNFVMPQIFGRNRAELGVTTSTGSLKQAELSTREHLQSSAAQVAIESMTLQPDGIKVRVSIQNQAGHKLPTAYPSRRAWLHFRASDPSGAVLFESGALQENGSITGNNNDSDETSYEPHYQTITAEDQVQIYEDIMATPDGSVTTGLLTATQYIKDNRLLPKGFDKEDTQYEIAVLGAAISDPDFKGGGDNTAYHITLPVIPPKISISVRFLYQPIGYRWATNLADFDANEPQRFVRYYRQIAPLATVVLASTSASFMASTPNN